MSHSTKNVAVVPDTFFANENFMSKKTVALSKIRS